MKTGVKQKRAVEALFLWGSLVPALIQLAKGIRAARQCGEASGLSVKEIAFYKALAENESAVQMMGDDKLKLIAHELLMSLRENVSVDWAHRDSARARSNAGAGGRCGANRVEQAEALPSVWRLSKLGSV